VKKGDCLSVVAERYGLNVQEVMALNGIKDKDMVRVGQKLVLPGSIDLDAPPPPKKTRPRPRRVAMAGAGNEYVVKKGDCISVIASRYGTTSAAIRQANGLTDDKIMVGQKLIVPGELREAPPPAAARPRPVVDAEPAPPVEDIAPLPSVPPEPEPVVRREERSRPDRPVLTRPHTVEEGEDLNTIGMMYDVGITELMAVNNLSDTSLEPGQVLRIPMAE